MRKLKPSLSTVKTTVDNVIDFFFSPHNSIKEHLIVGRQLALVVDSVQHNAISFVKTLKLHIKKLRMFFRFLTYCNQLKN